VAENDASADRPDRQSGRYDAVICDLDGCLASENTAPFDLESLGLIAERNRRAIEMGEGPIVTVCTGRPQPFAEAMCRLIANTRLPCVCENGVWLYDPASNGYERDPRLTPEHLDRIAEITRWVESELGPRGVTIQPGKVASISLYHPDAEYLREEVFPLVSQAFEVCGWAMRVSMTWFYINCDFEFISKGTGLDRMIEQTGLRPDRLAGIGDTPGDLVIAERVAWFGCPANAHERIRARADAIADREEAAGVLELLDRLAEPPA